MHLPSISRSQTLIRRKIDIRAPNGNCRVYADARERPFSRLGPTDLLDTADISRLYGVSSRTVYRWVAERGLKPFVKSGRELLFRKQAIIDWDENFRPVRGRPFGS